LITITRRQARRLRAVFRRHSLGIAHRGLLPPLVFTTDPTAELRVRHRQAHLAVECLLEGSGWPEEAIALGGFQKIIRPLEFCTIPTSR
jgi:hypothetical protein